MDAALITREEITQALLAILDLNENVSRIRELLDEEDDDDGEETEGNA